MGKTYTNQIVESEVSIAIERLLIAPYPGTWDKTKLDISSPPPGFKDAGAVVEDSPSLTITRNPFQLKTGLPVTLQYEAIMGVDGKFEIAIYSSSNRKVKYALANVAPINVTDPVTPNGVVRVSSCTRMQVVWSSTPSVIPSAGDWIVTGSSTLTTVESRHIYYSENEAQVASVDVASGIIYLVAPGLPSTPLAGDVFAKLVSVKLPLGGSSIRRYTLLGVADFLNGAQVVHYFPKASSAGEWTEQIRPGDVGKINLGFSLYGYSSTDYEGGEENLIVGERYYFPETVV